MSAIGCFAMNNEQQLEWEECSVPTCKEYCSPYPSCDVTECINEDDSMGVFYRIDFLFRIFSIVGYLIPRQCSSNRLSVPLRWFEFRRIFPQKMKISIKRGKMAIANGGKTCFPWKEVMDIKQNFDFYGRQTTTYVPRYK